MPERCSGSRQRCPVPRRPAGRTRRPSNLILHSARRLHREHDGFRRDERTWEAAQRRRQRSARLSPSHNPSSHTCSVTRGPTYAQFWRRAGRSTLGLRHPLSTGRANQSERGGTIAIILCEGRRRRGRDRRSEKSQGAFGVAPPPGSMRGAGWLLREATCGHAGSTAAADCVGQVGLADSGGMVRTCDPGTFDD